MGTSESIEGWAAEVYGPEAKAGTWRKTFAKLLGVRKT